MQAHLIRAACASLLVVASAAAAHAQQADSAARRPSVYLLPSVGAKEGSVLGRHPGGTPSATALGDSHVFGVAAEVRTPVRGVDVRAGLSYSRPRLRQETETGEVTPLQSRATLVTAMVDVVVRGPRVLSLRPYALVGVGARHYSWGDEPIGNAPGTPFVGPQISPVARLGAGVAWDVGRYELYLEHDRVHDALKASPRFQPEPVDDVSWTLGLRIPIK
jgi:hypothetical protein